MSEINSFLQKSFASCESSIIPLGMIAYELVKCAKAHTYVETLGDHADTLHRWVKQGYDEDFKIAFERAVKRALKILGVSHARLAFDVTPEPFYGKTSSLYLFGVDKSKSWNAEFHYAVACLITRKKQIPLMAVPVRVGEGVAKPTIELLDYCQTLFRSIRFAVFDRGYYCAELIDYLVANKIKYLILVPEKRGTISEYIEQTEVLGKYAHKMVYAKAKSKWKPQTTIVVCKGINEYAWVFATNISFNTRVEYIWHYKRRWQIETNFRVEDEARIKSKSTKHIIRYFYFLMSLVFHLFWIVNKNTKYYVPFKKYLDIIEHQLLHDYFNIDYAPT